MSFRALAPLALVALFVGVGCSKADVSMQNDLKGTPPVVAKGGIPDDSIKPKTLTPAPAPLPLPLPARGGIPDDSIKPGAPRPVPPKP